MSKFKAMTFQSLKRYANQAGMDSTEEDKAVMRDFMFMCIGTWTERELIQAHREGIISRQDYKDLSDGNLPLN